MKIDTYAPPLDDLTLFFEPNLDQSDYLATTPVVAQYFEDNFFSRSGEIFSNFVESGQVWALLVGIVIGYVIRGITTY